MNSQLAGLFCLGDNPHFPRAPLIAALGRERPSQSFNFGKHSHDESLRRVGRHSCTPGRP